MKSLYSIYNNIPVVRIIIDTIGFAIIIFALVSLIKKPRNILKDWDDYSDD